jgi:hypothetical protein
MKNATSGLSSAYRAFALKKGEGSHPFFLTVTDNLTAKLFFKQSLE